KMGRVKIFKFGILVFTISSVLCGFSASIESLIVFRTIQGIGGALMIPGSLSIISSVFSKEEKGKAIGTWSAATTIVMICGPVLGGALASVGLWRFIFFINLPLGIISYLILQYRVPESVVKGSPKIDWLGAILLIVSLSLQTYGFLEMPESGFDNLLVSGTIISGIVLFILFIYVEYKVADPMIPLDLFKNRTFSGVNLLSFFLYAGLGGIMLFFSLNLIQIQGYSELQAGLTFLPFSFLMVLMGRKMGSLKDKYGARNFLIFGPLITGIGIFGMSMIEMTAGPGEYWTTYFPWFMIFAFGMSITVVPLTTIVMTSVADEKSGTASGINNSVTRIAGTFVNAFVGALAVYLFVGFVSEGTTVLELTDLVTEEIMMEATNLGEAKSNVSYPEQLRTQVDQLFDISFVKTYGIVGYISASLAFVSSLIAFFTIKNNQ
ncbi:MAG: MFS transporter, partial [Bacteroidota bacterium]